MGAPIAVLAKVAATPEQAKVWVSMLQAHGIPAHVDGESLVDDYAISRRLMNLLGVRVMVPGTCVERARELLATHEVKPLPEDVDRHIDRIIASFAKANR